VSDPRRPAGHPSTASSGSAWGESGAPPSGKLPSRLFVIKGAHKYRHRVERMSPGVRFAGGEHFHPTIAGQRKLAEDGTALTDTNESFNTDDAANAPLKASSVSRRRCSAPCTLPAWDRLVRCAGVAGRSVSRRATHDKSFAPRCPPVRLSQHAASWISRAADSLPDHPRQRHRMIHPLRDGLARRRRCSRMALGWLTSLSPAQLTHLQAKLKLCGLGRDAGRLASSYTGPRAPDRLVVLDATGARRSPMPSPVRFVTVPPWRRTTIAQRSARSARISRSCSDRPPQRCHRTHHVGEQRACPASADAGDSRTGAPHSLLELGSRALGARGRLQGGPQSSAHRRRPRCPSCQ
jgi:hypothetical protein